VAEKRLVSLLKVLLDTERKMEMLAGGPSYELYEVLHSAVGQLAPVDAFYVCLYSAAENNLYFSYHFDGQAYDEPVTLPIGTGPTSWVVLNKMPLVLGQNTREVHHGGVGFGDRVKQSRSAVHVPLLSNDTALTASVITQRDSVLGVLSAQSYQRDVYDDEFVTAFQLLASRTAQVLVRGQQQVVWQARLDAADSRIAQMSQRITALTSQFVQILKAITSEAEALRTAASSGEGQPLATVIERLCRTCYRSQTEASELPLRLDDAPAQGDSILKSTTATIGTMASETTVEKELRKPLTEREREILLLLVRGESYATIAKTLLVSLHTVKFHCRNLYRKLGVAGRHQAAQMGRKLVGDTDRT